MAKKNTSKNPELQVAQNAVDLAYDAFVQLDLEYDQAKRALATHASIPKRKRDASWESESQRLTTVVDAVYPRFLDAQRIHDEASDYRDELAFRIEEAEKAKEEEEERMLTCYRVEGVRGQVVLLVKGSSKLWIPIRTIESIELEEETPVRTIGRSTYAAKAARWFLTTRERRNLDLFSEKDAMKLVAALDGL